MRLVRRHGVFLIAWALMLSLVGGCAWLGAETPDSLMKDGQQLYLDKKYDASRAELQEAGEGVDQLTFLGKIASLSDPLRNHERGAGKEFLVCERDESGDVFAQPVEHRSNVLHGSSDK